MNGPGHYRAAERLIHRSEEMDPQDAALFLQQAQVHATLAHAAAIAASTLGQHGVPSGDWQEAMLYRAGGQS